MPELPEVETVARALARALRGRTIVGVEWRGGMRLPFDAGDAARRLTGRVIRGVRRRAKYIVVDLDSREAILAHLGMTGCFRIDPASEPPRPHDRLAIRLDRGGELRYSDVRRFGFVVPVRLERGDEWPGELSRLGAEPLERGFSARSMLERARGRRAPVKAFIMDQAVVVGVGNIYASEALFAARVDPRREAGSLEASEWKTLVGEIRKVLRRAIRRGGSSIRDYRGVDGSEGGFQRSLRVYGRAGEPCVECGSPIAAMRQGGRTTFFCENCQG